VSLECKTSLVVGSSYILQGKILELQVVPNARTLYQLLWHISHLQRYCLQDVIDIIAVTSSIIRLHYVLTDT